MPKTLIDTLRARQLLQDISDEAGISKLGKGDSFYVGFDPTAPSLQVGNLVPILLATRIAQAGLHPIILFGGATAAIGDPSGKNEERKLLSNETIEANLARQKKQVEKIFARLNCSVEFVNNYDWTKDVRLLEFLRDIGKFLTVNYMTGKEVVRTRLEGSGISYTEFSYMLLQAMDFLHLYRKKNCKLQVGGSDQWGNITAGLELIRKVEAKEAFALSAPLITDSSGKKFGKSEGGAIWLDSQMTSSFRFHQYWLNTDDRDVMRFIRMFTFIEEAEIMILEQSLKVAPGERAAQKALADSICTLVHGEEATEIAKKSAQVLFGGSFEGLSDSQLEDIFSDVPSTKIPNHKLQNINFLDLLIETGSVNSKGDGRRLISSGGIYFNNQRVSETEFNFQDSLSPTRKLFVIRTGKKHYHLVKIID